MDTVDKETMDMLDAVLDDTADDVKLDLLKNILVYPRYQEMSIKKILESELKAKTEMERDFQQRKEERNNIVKSWETK